MDMDISNMNCFVTVCKYKNITKAAEVLHISQSALSRRIMSMEEELGVQLLIRGGGYLEITPAGHVFLEEAERAIRKYNQLEKKLEKFKYGNAIVIGIYRNLDLRLLIERIEKAKFLNNELEFFYKENSLKYNTEELINGNVDIIYTTRGEVGGGSKYSN
jgi:DNA-binding transcriptional LysR family regulator